MPPFGYTWLKRRCPVHGGDRIDCPPVVTAIVTYGDAAIAHSTRCDDHGYAVVTGGLEAWHHKKIFEASLFKVWPTA